MQSHIGEFAALATAFFWTITALSFESAGKRVGSLAVNWIRLLAGLIFLTIFNGFFRGSFFALDASAHVWIWLSLSGLIGFVIGDLLLFRAFVEIGSRISMLLMALVPPMTAIMGWMLMNETLSAQDFFGMGLTLTGIALVVLEHNSDQNTVLLKHPLKGILLAVGGAAGQAIGLVLSKFGMKDYDSFSATQIRVFAGLVGFTVLFFIVNSWPRVRFALMHASAMKFILTGAFFGPFLGVSFSLMAVQHTQTGVATTIMAIVPVLIIPPAVIFMKEKVTFKEILGAVIAIVGVALLFL